jgi:hypothetical protein
MLNCNSLVCTTAMTALIGTAAAGCSGDRTASANPSPAYNTMALAQGDAVGRALLRPAPAAQAPETATAQVDLSPADE